MALVEAEILQALMKARTRLSAAAWLVVRDTHAAEDIFPERGADGNKQVDSVAGPPASSR